jgi:hypothetical protein
MREDQTFPSLENMQDEHARRLLWLRQSVTFSVNGQTRTIEMALPVRPGASVEELEALLDEADAGMRRLSRRLDAHIAEAQHAEGTSRPTSVQGEPATQMQPATAAVALTPTSAQPERRPQPHPQTQLPPPTARPAERAAEATPRPTQPQKAPTRPESIARPSATPAPAAPLPNRPAAAHTQPSQLSQTPTRSQPSTPLTLSAATAQPDISRAEFLAEASALGLTPKQAMDRLGVRSLSGLNLREALATLPQKPLSQSVRLLRLPASPHTI